MAGRFAFTYLVWGFSLYGTMSFAAAYDTIVREMRALEQLHPSVSKVFSIGKNDDGDEIYAMRVGIAPQQMDPAKIGQIIVSTHHGNEKGAPKFTMLFLKDLITRYASKEMWRGELASQEWTIIPVLNISGFNRDERLEHGQDPNRDYPSPCATPSALKLKSIQNLVAYLKSRPFTGSVTVHGYDGSFTYPWGMYVTDYHTKDHDLYESLFRKAAQVNNYTWGNGGVVVYPANGCYEDYVYWKHGSWSLLLELRDGSDSDVQSTVPAIRVFFDSLNASPSNQNQFEAQCTRTDKQDFRWE